MGSAPPRIGVVGNVASGKTTWSNAFAERMRVPCFAEAPAENPWFASSALVPRAYSFRAQAWFLSRAISDLVGSRESGGVLERLPSEHVEVFARRALEHAWMSQAEFDVLKRLTEAESLSSVDAIVVLQAPVETLLVRASGRARVGEVISHEILSDLHERYQVYLTNLDPSVPKFTVDTELGPRLARIDEISAAIRRSL